MWNDQRQGFGGSPGFAPVKEGEEIEVTIEAVGAKGDGIAKKEGFVIFVPEAKQGDKVKIRITRVLSRVGFGQIIGSAEGSSSSEPAAAEEGEGADAPAEEKTTTPKKDEEFFEGHEDTEDFGEEEKE